jgi:peptidoglycan/LPS O-acetylase OafA/YrhL
MRLNRIDEIRGLAAFMVVFTHWTTYFRWEGHPYLSNLRWINEAYTTFISISGTIHPGVLVFIVLSGFVIHYPQALKGESAGFKLTHFLKKRFLRIYPPLIVTLSVSYLVHIYIVGGDIEAVLVNLGLSLLSVYAFVDVEPPFQNPILVTVLVEVILYIQYALFIRWLNFKYLIIYSVALFVVAVLSAQNTYWSQHNIFSFSMYWLIGALAAELFVKRRNVIKKFTSLDSVWMALCLVSLSIYFYQGYSSLTNRLIVVGACISIALLVVNLALKSGIDKEVFVYQRVMTFLGEISYSLYLSHVIVFKIYFQLFLSKSMTPASHIFSLAVAIFVGWLMYVTIEKGTMKLIRKVN